MPKTFKREEITFTREEKAAFDQLPEGNAAALEAGTPISFCETLIDCGRKYKMISVLRGGEHIEESEIKSEQLPKPPWVAAKSTDWDFIRGHVATRDLISILGKRSSNENKQYTGIVNTDQSDIPDDLYPPPLVKSIPHFITKKELELKNHTIISKNETEILMIANDDPRPEGQKVIFKVELTPDEPYPVYCKQPHEESFKRVEVLGMANQDGELIPIGRDQDACFFGVHHSKVLPEEKNASLPAKAHETLNTFTPGGRSNMISTMKELTGKNAETSEVVHLGCASAYEGIFLSNVDDEHKKKTNINTNNFQHGAENHTPKEKRSNIDGKMLHIYFDEHNVPKIKMTRTEKELAYMAQSYSSQYYFEVHPKWNMKLWASVIEKQLISGFSIHAETMVNYLAYKNNEHVPENRDEYKAFIKQKLSEEVIVGDFKLTPLNRIHVQPIQNMEIWGPIIQEQLSTLTAESKSSLKNNIRPQALLAYYHEKFNITDSFVDSAEKNSSEEKKSDLKKLIKENYVVFENALIKKVLKEEKAIATIYIHPEFDLEKWLPVFIKKLEAANGNEKLMDKEILNAYRNLYNEYNKPLKSSEPLTPEKLYGLERQLEGKIKVFSDSKEKSDFKKINEPNETKMLKGELRTGSNVAPSVHNAKIKRHSFSGKRDLNEEHKKTLQQRAKQWKRSASVMVKRKPQETIPEDKKLSGIKEKKLNDTDTQNMTTQKSLR